jgi:hypothetical protein
METSVPHSESVVEKSVEKAADEFESAWGKALAKEDGKQF